MVPEFTKAEMRQLREHAATIYDAEADRILVPLDQAFDRWRRREINSAELIHQIHRFHQDDARGLWTMYQSLKAYEIVARGIALGLFQEPLPDPLRGKLKLLIERYQPRGE